LDECLNDLIEMREGRNKWRRDYGEAKEKYEEELGSKLDHIESLQKSLVEMNAQLTNLTKQYSDLQEAEKSLRTRLTSLEDMKNLLESERDDLKAEVTSLVQGNLELREKLTNEIAKQKLGDFSRREIFKEALRCIFKRR
jgi:chromosome segregation ATPase